MWSIIAANVVDLPEPVVPVSRMECHRTVLIGAAPSGLESA